VVPQIVYGGSRESGRDPTESIYQLPKFKSRNKNIDSYPLEKKSSFKSSGAI
jgi:hypothetical protein